MTAESAFSKPQGENMPPIDLEPILSRHIEKLLRSCGFRIRDTVECSGFLQTLKQFNRFISNTFAPEIENQLRREDNVKTRDDLISWTASELQHLQSITFHRFERLISTSEAIQSAPDKIDCVMASSYTFRLSEIYQLAAAEWRSQRQIEPMSQKHQDKRRSRNWTPYLVDIFFPK